MGMGASSARARLIVQDCGPVWWQRADLWCPEEYLTEQLYIAVRLSWGLSRGQWRLLGEVCPFQGFIALRQAVQIVPLTRGVFSGSGWRYARRPRRDLGRQCRSSS